MIFFGGMGGLVVSAYVFPSDTGQDRWRPMGRLRQRKAL